MLIKLKCSEKSPAWSEENPYLHRENQAFFRGKVLHEYILSDSKVRDMGQVSYLVEREKESDGKHCLGSHQFCSLRILLLLPCRHMRGLYFLPSFVAICLALSSEI